MARILMFAPGAANPFFYNVDSTVGAASQNKRDDVLLVQYFIKTIFDNPSLFSPALPPLPLSPGQIFKVDGVAGPITFRAIKHYQETLVAQRRIAIAPDGRVDAAKVGSGITTILFLNTDYKKVRANDFNNIGAAFDCPKDLKGSVALIA